MFLYLLHGCAHRMPFYKNVVEPLRRSSAFKPSYYKTAAFLFTSFKLLNANKPRVSVSITEKKANKKIKPEFSLFVEVTKWFLNNGDKLY